MLLWGLNELIFANHLKQGLTYLAYKSKKVVLRTKKVYGDHPYLLQNSMLCAFTEPIWV